MDFGQLIGNISNTIFNTVKGIFNKITETVGQFFPVKQEKAKSKTPKQAKTKKPKTQKKAKQLCHQAASGLEFQVVETGTNEAGEIEIVVIPGSADDNNSALEQKIKELSYEAGFDLDVEIVDVFESAPTWSANNSRSRRSKKQSSQGRKRTSKSSKNNRNQYLNEWQVEN